MDFFFPTVSDLKSCLLFTISVFSLLVYSFKLTKRSDLNIDLNIENPSMKERKATLVEISQLELFRKKTIYEL